MIIDFLAANGNAGAMFDVVASNPAGVTVEFFGRLREAVAQRSIGEERELRRLRDDAATRLVQAFDADRTLTGRPVDDDEARRMPPTHGLELAADVDVGALPALGD